MSDKVKEVKIIGIDEAGRGPLAGPVVVGGVCVKNIQAMHHFFQGIRDSKKLTEKRREEWYKKITTDPCISWTVASIAPRVIDTINIAQAANRGAWHVFKKLAGMDSCATHTMLDGNLYLPQYISHETIIKGDEKVPIIAAASIIAKVTRDRLMRRLHKKYPKYLFDIHKGYGTRMHRKLLLQYGISSVHRVTFCRKILTQS